MTTVEQKVKKQYTEYTYPKYRYEWDKDRLRGPSHKSLMNLKLLNHYCYDGKKQFKNFRLLVAGCGLGTNLIHWAMYLKKYNGEVVGIDLSSSALKILKKRLKIYKIKNVTIHQMSLLDLDPKKMGLFDHITCVGVLHHLKDPKDGLNKLSSVLKKDGNMDIMVYAQYGRTGVYQMQKLLCRVNEDVPDYETKISNYKKIYAQLPPTHLLKQFEHVIGDHKKSDNGIVDLLLHCQDRAYTIPQLYNFVQSCNLNLTRYLDPRTRKKLTVPISTIDYKNMTQIKKEAINELYYGDIIKHHILVSKKKQKLPSTRTQEKIPIYHCILKSNLNFIIKMVKSQPLNIQNYSIPLVEVTNRNDKDHVFAYRSCSPIVMALTYTLHKTLIQLLEYIDEKRSLQQIGDLLKTKHNASKKDIQQAMNWLDEYFIQNDLILLKYPSSDV